MKLIVGLGNPGLRYKKTKHNAGFWVIDGLAKKFDIKFQKRKFNALWVQTIINGENIILAKPQTYMNLSGNSVRSFADYFNIASNDILVVFDDIHLALGTIRLRPEGSAGGHNGLSSVITCMGTKDIPRLRMGVKTEHNVGNLADYVLSSFNDKNAQKLAKDMVNLAEQAVEDWIEKGITFVMNNYNKTNT